jgi:hypothetical protein
MQFRRALERCPRAYLPISFRDFPQGSCGDATLLIAKFLQEKGHTGFVYVLGMRNAGSHAWLSRDRLVVDITADQFEDQDQPVIVVVDSQWHSAFDIDEDKQYPVDFEKYDSATAVMMRKAYQAVLRQLTNDAKCSAA